VLDLGCAAGRNAVELARRGYDVYAVDASGAMVARTRDRIAGILGSREARKRVLRGSMADLSFESETFDLVVALGILHQAASEGQWKSAIAEIARVLKPEGRVLVAAWSPRSRPDGVALVRVADEDDVYEGFRSGRHYLVDAAALDRRMADRGLAPVVPTEEVEVEMGAGHRVTVNGLYRKEVV
jgi:SAM-dependent methyltransferase